MDELLLTRKAIASKNAKLQMLGKRVEYDEAEALKEEACAIAAWEEEQEEREKASKHKPCYVHEAVVESLRRELDTVRSQLMHHSTSRELALLEEVKVLKERCAKLEARTHWEAHYAWTLPGAFLLTEDGECECTRERRLYGGTHGGGSAGALADSGGKGDAGAGSLCGRAGGGQVRVRRCACGGQY